ncbi:CRTAC1 family protein [Streptomyces polyrhachis]|uniref:CRTAC1 family protein n=1 Tax=Streptomyces polyrhachis TaxID=1282885 RepID=A0ABW2GNG9_9ACTN
MTPVSRHLREHAVKAVALGCCLGALALAWPEDVSARDRAQAAAPFSFAPLGLNAPTRAGDRTVRPVAPAFRDIRSWISSVGAGAGVFAADGGTRARDICLVDTRTDTVTVRPAPRTGKRFAPFTLQATGLPMPSYAAPMGCTPADFNQDGWQDVAVYYWGRSPVLFMRVPGAKPGARAYVARELVEGSPVWNTNAMTVGDYDGDGRPDLVVGNYFLDGARVLDPTAEQDSLQMPSSMSNAGNGGSLRVFRFASGRTGADPQANFTEVEDAFGDKPLHGWTLALASQDLDGDGRPEVYQANDFAPDRLLVNNSEPGAVRFATAKGSRHFTTPKSKVVGRDSFKGMGVAFADLEADGKAAIVVGNITEDYALHESNFVFKPTASRKELGRALHRGEAPYDDHSESMGMSRSGWTWDVAAADFDNSGYPQVMHATGFVKGKTPRWAQLQEAAMGNDLILKHPGLWPDIKPGDDLSGSDPNTFFVRTAKGRYVDVAKEAGVGSTAVTRGFAVGDVDADGRLDFVAANQWGQSVLYHNRSKAGDFVGLRLRLPAGARGASTPATGAVARLHKPGGAVSEQQLYPAGGHGGVAAPELLFGLGARKAETPVKVDVSWRDTRGRTHRATTTLRPGWHDLLLTADGTIREVRA